MIAFCFSDLQEQFWEWLREISLPQGPCPTYGWPSEYRSIFRDAEKPIKTRVSRDSVQAAPPIRHGAKNPQTVRIFFGLVDGRADGLFPARQPERSSCGETRIRFVVRRLERRRRRPQTQSVQAALRRTPRSEENARRGEGRKKILGLPRAKKLAGDWEKTLKPSFERQWVTAQFTKEVGQMKLDIVPPAIGNALLETWRREGYSTCAENI